MSSSWAAPDPRPVVTAPPVFAPPPVPPPVAPEDPPLPRELLAGTLTALAVLVSGPVVGLLWAALAPRAGLSPDGFPQDPETSAFIAADGVFLIASALTGLLGGLLAWRLGRRYGLGVVLGLAVGGLAAAFLARTVGEAAGAALGESVGELVGRSGAAAVQESGAGPAPFDFRLRSPQALVALPTGALLGFVAAAVLAGRSTRASSAASPPEPEPEQAPA